MFGRLAILSLLLLPAIAPAAGNPGLALPELGSGAPGYLNGTAEADIGRQIYNQLRRNNMILDDPEVAEYVQHLGSRLVSAVDNGQTSFTFFVVKDDAINAFALPGGYIGVHSGLIVRTRNESELAGVLAHEIAHVTQRHIARRFDAATGMNLKALGMVLGAIAMAAAGADGDDVSGALMLGHGLAVQEQINFTRAQEYEADRLGVETLSRAGFDPNGMVSFFETMQRVQRLQNSRMPEFLSTHPLSLSRISEAAQRVQAMDTVTDERESRAYPLMKARLAVLTGEDPLVVAGPPGDSGNSTPLRYARALDLIRDGESETAVAMLRELVAEDDSIIYFHTALGRALLEAGRRDEAIAVLARASDLFPDNIPVAIGYAEALRRADRPDVALELLRGVFNRRTPEPEQIRKLAQLAAETGETAESHYYMAEYYLRVGDLGSARVQLELALDYAAPASSERLQYQARLDEVSRALLEARRNAPRRDRERER